MTLSLTQTSSANHCRQSHTGGSIVDKDIIAGKIEELQKEKQERLNVIASNDLVFTNIQTAINVWNEVLGELKDDPVDIPASPKTK
jgi:hypothetical protein